jgi:hypothetical protein
MGTPSDRGGVPSIPSSLLVCESLTPGLPGLAIHLRDHRGYPLSGLQHHGYPPSHEKRLCKARRHAIAGWDLNWPNFKISHTRRLAGHWRHASVINRGTSSQASNTLGPHPSLKSKRVRLISLREQCGGLNTGPIRTC